MSAPAAAIAATATDHSTEPTSTETTIAGVPVRAYYDANLTLPQLWDLTGDLLNRMERATTPARRAELEALFNAAHDVIDAKERRRDERQRRRQERALAAWGAS